MNNALQQKKALMQEDLTRKSPCFGCQTWTLYGDNKAGTRGYLKTDQCKPSIRIMGGLPDIKV